MTNLPTIPEEPKKHAGGRPVGSKTEITKMREKTKEDMMRKIFHMSSKLINAQSIVAVGTHKMVQMMKGPGDTVMTRTVRDMDEMQKLLDEGVYGVDYVIVIGKEPDAKAANMLLDRAFGRAKESIEITNPVLTEEEKVKTGDNAIADYLQGKRGFTMPDSMKTENKDAENIRTNTS